MFKQIIMNRVEKRGAGLIKHVQPVDLATASGKMAEAFEKKPSPGLTKPTKLRPD